MEAEDLESYNPGAQAELRMVKYEPVIEWQMTALERTKKGKWVAAVD
jgi:hypothetical protein